MIGESRGLQILLALLNDVLDLSKIEAGRLDLEEADFDLGALALGAQTMFKPLADDKGLDFTIEVASEAAGTYRGDPLRVRQILFNIDPRTR